MRSPRACFSNGSIGSLTPLNNLLTDSVGTTRFDNTLVGASSAVVNVSNNITFNDNVTTSANITFTSSNLTFGKSFNPTVSNLLDANFIVGNNLSSANMGAVTSFGNLSANVGGNLLLGGTMNATVNTSIQGNIVLTAASTINGTQNTFINGTIDGAQALAVNAIITTFGGNIGSMTPLANLFTE